VQKDEAVWYHATSFAGYLDEHHLRTENSQKVYSDFATKHKEIMSKGNLPKKKVTATLLTFGIGTPYDAAGRTGDKNIANPSDIATDEQLKMYRAFVDTMKGSPVTSDRNYFSSSWMHNSFLHLLLHNPNLKSEKDIAEQGFRRIDIFKRPLRLSTIRTIQNVYRVKCGLPLLLQHSEKRDRRELTLYQDRHLEEIASIDDDVATWAERVCRLHRHKCIARNLCISTIDAYSNTLVHFLLYCTRFGVTTPHSIATTHRQMRDRIVEYAYEWVTQSTSDNARAFIKRVVATLNILLGSDDFPIEGTLNQKEIVAIFFERHPDIPIRNDEDTDVSGDIDHAGRQRDYFTEDEMTKLDAIASDKDVRTRLIYTLFKNTGLRINALRHLKLSNVWNMLLDMPLAYGHAAEKGRSTRIFAIQRDSELTNALTTYIRAHPVLLQIKTYLFPAHGINGAKPIGKSTLYKTIRALCSDAEISGRHVHPHAFRKTMIIRLAREGNTVDKIAKYVGHSSSKTTFDHYWTPTMADLTMSMHIPWLNPGSNEVTLASLGKLPSQSEPTESSLTSSDDFRNFLENNYLPMVKRMHALQAELALSQKYLQEELSDKTIQAYRTDLDLCRQAASDQIATGLTLQEVLDDTELDKIAEADEDDDDNLTGNTGAAED
jgi:integrase